MDMDKKPSLDPIEAILFEELIKGRDLANKLLQLVRCHHTYHHGISNNNIIGNEENDLVNNILGSFTNTLFLLNTTKTYNSSSSSTSHHHAYPKTHDHDKDQSCKILMNQRNQRGRYKRKRNVESWEKDSPILAGDGYAWRKYGQKMTTDAKYIRDYYRCSHMYEEGCPATKYVQRIQENPPLYRTTYFGLHTCNIAPQGYPNYDNYPSILISFNHTHSHNNSNNTLPIPTKPFVSSSSSSSSMNKLEDHNIVKHDDDDPMLSSIKKVESFGGDDVILRCFKLDEFMRFGR